MQTGDERGFGNRWELTAPESYALLYGPKDARQIFKLAVLELVARRRLELAEIEDPGRSGRPRKYAVLRYGPNRERPESRPLEAVFSLFTGPVASPAGGRRTEMAVPDLARSAMNRYGTFEGYVEACIMTGLQSRNLFERRTRRRFWIFQTTRWEPTHSGEAAKAELRGSMTLGEEQFAGWVDEEPSRALQFLGLAGSSVLLMPPLHRDVRRLRENPEYRRSSDDWVAAGYFPVIGATSVGDHQDHQHHDDPGGLDLDAIGPGGFDSHSDASSAIDSGLSGGGFWGDGGSGGDGDGGGSGGDGGGGGWGGNGGGGGFGGGDGGGGGGGG